MKEPSMAYYFYKIFIVYHFALMFYPSPIIYTFYFIINNIINQDTGFHHSAFVFIPRSSFYCFIG